MVLCYVYDVLAITNMPMITMDGIRSVFKLKDDKAEVPDVYLGATLSQVETETGTKCWSMSSENYAKAAIDNLESKLTRVTCTYQSAALQYQRATTQFRTSQKN